MAGDLIPIRRLQPRLVVSAYLGAWLAIFPHAVLTLARLLGASDDETSARIYSLTLALGWLTLLATVAAWGRWSDKRRVLTRLAVLPSALVAVIASTLLLIWAPTDEVTALMWVVLQIPAGIIIAATLATGADLLRHGSSAVLSGAFGAGAILALLAGSLILQVISDLQMAVLAILVCATMLIAPSALRAHRVPTLATVDEAVLPAEITPGWRRFLLASLLLSWATSTTNSYITLYVADVVMPDDSGADSATTFAVLVASLVTGLASLFAGALITRGRRPRHVASFGALIMALALIVALAVPDERALLLVAGLFGTGFGMVNGAELVLITRLGRTSTQGANVASLTALTLVPYVGVPIVAAPLLGLGAATGITALFAMSLVMAAVGAALLASTPESPRT